MELNQSIFWQKKIIIMKKETCKQICHSREIKKNRIPLKIKKKINIFLQSKKKILVLKLKNNLVIKSKVFG